MPAPQTLIVTLTSLVLTAFATATTTERQQLVESPVVCEQADQDIARLEAARPSSAERGRKLLQSVTPPGVITGLVTGQYQDRADVAIGSMSQEIDDKIGAIQTTCSSISEGPEIEEALCCK